MELAFERMMAAVEATRGTAVDPPTYAFNMRGKITPRQSFYRPDDARGLLEQYGVSKVTRQWCEWEMSGPLNVQNLPLWQACAWNGSITPSTPATGTTSRLWLGPPTNTTDDIKTITLYWGDPTVQIWQTKYAALQSLEITADAGSTDGLTLSLKGVGHWPTAVTPSATPALADHPLIGTDRAQLWLDTTSAIGTTAITGRMISSKFMLDTGIVPKWLAGGNSLNYTMLGRGQRAAQVETKVEVFDTNQYNLFAEGLKVKQRVRWEGDIIEAALRWRAEWDCYGAIDSVDWSEYEGTNRVYTLKQIAEYDTTATHSARLNTQNTRTAL